jgi:hypothetical protein
MSIQNIIEVVPCEYTEHWMPKASSMTWEFADKLYTYAPGIDSSVFRERFPEHQRILALLEASGSSWSNKAYLFYVSDCYDPPLYIQFGSSFEDAHESYLDNDESLLISVEDQKDYAVESESPTCSFNSNGAPVDAESVGGQGPLKLVVVRFDKE